MSVRLRIQRDVYTGNYDFLLMERENGQRFILRPTADGTWTRELIAEGNRVTPSFVLSEEFGREVLEQMATELAQLGHMQLNSAPSVEAQLRHIEDLQVANTRLFTLAERAVK